MKVQANEASSQPQNEATLALTPIQFILPPFNQNYTLTGLIKHIQSSLNDLIQTKKASATLEIAKQHSQMQKLLQIREEIRLLKTIILQNINQIFNNIYPSDKAYKKTEKTNHTNSSLALKNQLQHKKEMTITDFQVESLNEQLDSINHLQVNQENITHYNNLYPPNLNIKDRIFLSCEGEDDERTKVEKQRMQKEITPFQLPQFGNIPAIKIDQIQEDFEIDLVCYQDQKNINEQKLRTKVQQSNNEEGFSPILQRPVEEQETMQKQVKNQADMAFSQNQTPIFNLANKTVVCKPEIKKHLFTCENKAVFTERYPRKRYNYLQKASLK